MWKFDCSVMLLAEGKVAYFGATSGALRLFERFNRHKGVVT